MIVDSLAHYDASFHCHPRFENAFAFLTRDDLAALPEGKYPVDGDDLFVLIVKAKGKGSANAQLEVHRDYIDIQYVIGGKDTFGFAHLSQCTAPVAPFDTEKDIQFFTDHPVSYIEVVPGSFLIAFPQDAHAPMANDEPFIHKAIVKVRV